LNVLEKWCENKRHCFHTANACEPERVVGHGQVGDGRRDVDKEDGLALAVRLDLKRVLHEHRQAGLAVRNVVELV
jgi:hypothetical protein